MQKRNESLLGRKPERATYVKVKAPQREYRLKKKKKRVTSEKELIKRAQMLHANSKLYQE
jgi:hypothetical protein